MLNRIQDQLEELAMETNSIPTPEETKIISISNEELSAFVYLNKGPQCMHPNKSEKITRALGVNPNERRKDHWPNT